MIDPNVELALASLESGLAYAQSHQFANLVKAFKSVDILLYAVLDSYNILDARVAKLRAALTSIEVSEVGISALAEVVMEGGVAEFVVTRAGDVDMPCSVRWDGTTEPVDFLDGTLFTDHLSWAPGDVSERVISLPLKLDTIKEPDETVTVTLSDPVGCTIVTASAKVVVKDIVPGVTIKPVADSVKEGDKSPVLP